MTRIEALFTYDRKGIRFGVRGLPCDVSCRVLEYLGPWTGPELKQATMLDDYGDILVIYSTVIDAGKPGTLREKRQRPKREEYSCWVQSSIIVESQQCRS